MPQVQHLAGSQDQHQRPPLLLLLLLLQEGAEPALPLLLLLAGVPWAPANAGRAATGPWAPSRRCCCLEQSH
jgi:hypothetical protein